jgi:hypothetical protein
LAIPPAADSETHSPSTHNNIGMQVDYPAVAQS